MTAFEKAVVGSLMIFTFAAILTPPNRFGLIIASALVVISLIFIWGT
jgi:hypothetical protein